ncbi:glycosyltransferase family 2 protein [Companilactobacillus ginsenosidimutans]|uniref:glycosyltransferase family 2 protein n=1 Tax=Companilactobacillus ginsenosidimutans TaxID=1007676 RepID=UPI0006616207|nr:glycosyltransferase family 2 protein [Companilactobacillus ginsenosidimutans]
MENPLISVIIPAYNAEETIEKCILSLLEQDYSNFEIVVINDESTDQTNSIVQSMLNKHDCIRMYEIPHSGLAQVRNVGIKSSKGQFISFVDADDVVKSDYLSYLMNLLITFNTDISSCQHSVIKINGDIHSNELAGFSRIYNSHDWFQKMLVRDHLDQTCWAKLYKKSIFDGIEFPPGKLFEDSATIYKTIMKSESIAVGSESKYDYILRNNSITTSSFNYGKLDLISATESMTEEIIRKYPDLYPEAMLRLSWSHTSVLNNILLSGNDKECNLLVNKLREQILAHQKFINSDLNPDRRLKLACFALKFGTKFYKNCLKMMVLKEQSGR